MRKIAFLCIGLIILIVSVFGQKALKVIPKDMNMVIFRCTGDNETVVEVQSNVALTFESTMDKEITFCENKEENGFYFYQLKFAVERKFAGRKLKIKSYGFETYIEPLDLKAKVPVGLLVLDTDSDVGVGCYFEHLNKGNKFFENIQYANAKEEYLLALECSDMPDDNNLSQKIEDSGTAIDSKRAADSYYNAGKFVEAKREYEKLRGINPNDKYPTERIVTCDILIPNLPRTLRVKVTDDKGNNMLEVAFAADEYKVDKLGNLVLKKGKPQRKKGFVQATATYHNGIYSVTVKNVNQTLALSKYIDGKNEYYDKLQILPTTDELQVTLTNTRMTSAEKWNQGITVSKGVIDYFTKNGSSSR